MCYQKVRPETIDKILASKDAVRKLMGAFDYTEVGTRKLIKRNDLRLTTPVAKEAIIKSLGITENEIYETENAS